LTPEKLSPVVAEGWSSLSLDDRLVAAVLPDAIGFWDFNSGKALGKLSLNRPWFVHFGPGVMVTGDRSGTYCWPVRVDQRTPGRLCIGPPAAIGVPAGAPASYLSQDGKILVTAMGLVGEFEPWAGAWLWRAEKPGPPLHLAPGSHVWAVALSPDGSELMTQSDAPREMICWDARTGKVKRRFARQRAPSYSMDARWLVLGSDITTGDMRRLQLLDRRSGTIKRELPGWGGVFTRDSETLVTWDDQGVSLVEPRGGNQLVRLDTGEPDAKFRSNPLVSADNAHILTCQGDELYIWDLRRLREELAALGLD
jgi:hypothetical protein